MTELRERIDPNTVRGTPPMKFPISLVSVSEIEPKFVPPSLPEYTHQVNIQLWYPTTGDTPAGYVAFSTGLLPKAKAEAIARILDAEWEP